MLSNHLDKKPATTSQGKNADMNENLEKVVAVQHRHSYLAAMKLVVPGSPSLRNGGAASGT
eukprot:scaffold82903_cov34-Prasinocladus_malaysianus.AAC.3